jgi:hypothetical protein
MNCGTPLRAGEADSTKTTNAIASELRNAHILGHYLPPELVAKLESARIELVQLRGNYEAMLAIAEGALEELQAAFPAGVPKLMRCRADALSALRGSADSHPPGAADY